MNVKDPKTDSGLKLPSLSPTGKQHQGGYADVAGLDLGNGTALLLTYPATRTKTTPATSATSVQLLAADATRLAATIVNNDATKKLYLGYNGAAAVVGTGDFVAPNGALSIQAVNIAGQVNGIWEAGATGGASIVATTA